MDMSFDHDTSSMRLDEGTRRPSFSSRVTSDRLREGQQSMSSLVPGSRSNPHRRSVFREEGLEYMRPRIGHKHAETPSAAGEHDGKPTSTLDHVREDVQQNNGQVENGRQSLIEKLRGSRPTIKAAESSPSRMVSTSVSRTALIVMLICVVVPALRYGGGEDFTIGGADAGVIRTPVLIENGSVIEGRQDSPTSVCTRWAHQTANVNGTLYIFGGQATTEAGQNENTWNNDFLTLDLTKTWDISAPALTGLAQPSNLPAVAEGYLWHSWNSLWLYGGEFSDSPSTSPLPVSAWEYNIGTLKWVENSNPQTSAGNASEGSGYAVQRAAEGAGLSVPELGLSWYFGGHLDMYTTNGWSNQVARVYLKSLLEFTHPGYVNTGVSSLGSTTAAPSNGVYRNITEGGLQDSAGFTERADGVLVYVPGWGESGILLGLAGGTNTTFTEMNVIDVYDIANSTWYKQSTTGTTPPIRVNPCAVVAAAPDGSSFQVHLYGGQNLQPYDEQIQYSDIWILTIPSFTWIQVDTTGLSNPPARAGHTCNIWDAQMIVVGGYVGDEISCDSPGIYSFNLSSLQWTSSYTSLSSLSSSSSSGSGYDQAGSLQGSLGSYGYQVPALVQSVIGGSSLGGATVSTPASGPATAGPIATGRSPTFTITQSQSTVIQTAHSTATITSTQGSSPTKHSTNAGVIAASVVAGFLAFLAGYLAFCTWLYRRQLKLYKNHLAMAQRAAFASSPEGWTSSEEARGAVEGRLNEKTTSTGAMLGPFGTNISGSGSAGRPSAAGSAGTGRGHGLISQESSGNTSHSSQGSAVYGGGVMTGKGYGRSSEGEEGTEYLDVSQSGPNFTAHSSAEDLLRGQEPSFFSVVLNPRRTLRVVNLD